jgi:hypothetical protein
MGAGDLGRGQTADGPQSERDLRGRGERGAAAQKEQREGVVLGGSPALTGRGRGEGVPRGEGRDRLLAPAPGLLAAQLFREPPRRDLDQPPARIVRQPLLRPLLRGGEQRLLHGVLGRPEVPVTTHQRAEDLWRMQAQQVLDLGRTSHTQPPPASWMGRMTTG